MTHKDQSRVQELATAPVFRLPDAASTMEGALARALDFCTEKLNLPNPQASLERVRKGDGKAVEYCHYHLAQQVAEALGALDDHVGSVSLFEFDATPEDLALGEHSDSLPIHLLVRVDRKTSALNSLVAALDRALVMEYAEMIGPRRLGHVLDVQVVDGADIASRRGLAALFHSLNNRPIQLWER